MGNDQMKTEEVRPDPMYISYPSIFGLGILHILAIASIPYMYYYGVTSPDAIFHLLAYPIGGLGITALYHRCWTHHSVKFATPVEYALAALSTLVVQMPARQWISTHIKHHDHTDHDEDPYNIQRGFMWAHFEWIIFSPVPPIELPKRLEENAVVNWQEKWYWPIVALTNVIVPVAITIAAGAPWWGALLLSSLRLVLTSHMIYSVNSVCHMWGTRPFTLQYSARDVWWFPFALGEQYHNYHHAFPRDYRHGHRRFDFDPTKWFIQALAKIGLASDLFQMPERRIEQAKMDVLNAVSTESYKIAAE